MGQRTQIQLYEKRCGQWTPTETIPASPANMILVGDTLVYSASGVYIYEIGHGTKPRLIQTLKPLPSDTGRYGSEIALRGNFDGEFTTAGGEAYVFRKSHAQRGQSSLAHLSKAFRVQTHPEQVR